MEGKDLSVARRSFEAGARTYWHSHANGQLFMVEDGRMRTQKKGGPMRELGKGESDYAGPNVDPLARRRARAAGGSDQRRLRRRGHVAR